MEGQRLWIIMYMLLTVCANRQDGKTEALYVLAASSLSNVFISAATK